MNYNSPKSLTLRIALIIALIVSAVFVLLDLFFIRAFNFIHLGVFTIIVFTVCYFLIYNLLVKFLNKRIKLIYKSIWSSKMTENEDVSVDMSTDVLDTVKNEVGEWAETKKNEIEQLKQSEVYRKEFIGNVSHELKTPIFNIQGYLLTLLEGGLEDPSINRDYLEKADKNVERMIGIVNDLDVISRSDLEELQLDIEKVDIVDLTEEVFELQEMLAKKNQVKLKFKTDYDPIYVKADKDGIRQVLVNLVVNSIKYGRENGSTEIRFHNIEDRVMVEVADDGLGIAQHHLPRLFERFYRVDKSRSRNKGGTGLGLAIVKHIVESHGQTIQVRSTEGVGSTFSFTLEKL